MATRAECKHALAVFEEDLVRRRNVVGFGIVPVNWVVNRNDLAVAVYVRRKVAEEQLSQDDLIPRLLQVTYRGHDIEVPVIVIEQGTISLDSVAQ